MGWDNLYYLITYASIFSILIPIVVGIFKLKTLDQASRVLFIYLVISAFTDAFSYKLAHSSEKSVHAIQNVFVFLECLMLMYLYYLEFRTRFAQKLIAGIAIAYLILTCIVLCQPFTFFDADNICSTVESCILVVLSVSFFYTVKAEPNVPKLLDYPFFWVNSSILLYFATSFILFLFADYLAQSPHRVFQFFYGLQKSIHITSNILFAVALWKTTRR